MNRFLRAAAFALSGVLCPGAVAAQTYEVLGTRAAGMAGAFVAVADDASAVYWNPAGLASGAFFSLVLDHSTGSMLPDGGPRAGSSSGTLFSIAMPALGLSYYRLRLTRVRPPLLAPGTVDLSRDPSQAAVRLENLITHHTGATLVQSLTDRIAVAATLKLVRGVAAADFAAEAGRADLLDQAGDLVGAATNRFDADIGLTAVLGKIRAGLTIRNVAEPAFSTPGDTDRLRLERHARAGISATPIRAVVLAADLDLQRVQGPAGDVRNLAMGAEARVLTRTYVRSGFRFNTLGNQPAGRTPVVSVGGSYAALTSVLLDGHVTIGSEHEGRGWGLAARVVF